MAKLYTYTINHEYKWYAIYTRANHEKAVETFLNKNNIEAYLPKRKVLRFYSDRKKWIDIPLFQSYVFVCISNKEYFEVLQSPSVLSYICFEGQAAPIPNKQIDMIKTLVQENLDFNISDFSYQAAKKVKVIRGPLNGYVGEIIRLEGKYKLQIKISHLNSSILIDIDKKNVIAF